MAITKRLPSKQDMRRPIDTQAKGPDSLEATNQRAAARARANLVLGPRDARRKEAEGAQMVLTPRQTTAQRLTRELQAFGATVTSVLPLDEGKQLRFWCSDYTKNELLQLLKDAGYEAVFLGMDPQFCTRSQSQGLVNRFEVILPTDRQEIPQEEIGKRERSRETELMWQAIYGKQR